MMHQPIDRRGALKRLALLLGGTISAPVLSGVLGGCRAQAGLEAGAYVPQTLTADQHELVATVAELIIPTTDTPGARAAGVHTFIDQLLTRWFAPADRDRFLAGLDDLDARARAEGGVAFVESAPAVQTGILQTLDAEAIAARHSGAAELPFFARMKELTLVGYYTSEAGATQELVYVEIAGRYDGDVPLSTVGRAYARCNINN